jgi:hypothetical protein
VTTIPLPGETAPPAPMTGREVAGHLAGAAETQTVITVTVKGSRPSTRGAATFTGVPVLLDTPDGLTYKISTGKRGRPARVHADEVESIVAAEEVA